MTQNEINDFLYNPTPADANLANTGFEQSSQFVQQENRFVQAAAASGAPTGQPAQAAQAQGQAQLSTADAAPCATCDKNLPYSIAFRVKDKNGKLCGKDMYYTVKYKLSGEVYSGSTDENGLTQRYFSSNSSEDVYIYLGHRTKDDGYPLERTGVENTYDEAPLHHDTVAPVDEKKVTDATTQRLWKPWSISAAGEDFTSSREALRRNAYDADGAASRNVTIGIGKLIHHGPFVMNQSRVDQTVQYLRDNQQPVTVDNIVGAVGPATGLQGGQLRNAQNEMRYVNGMTTDQAVDLFKNDTFPAHRKNIEKAVKVPLHQNEYDALADITYNRGAAILDLEGRRNAGGSYASWLNRGRYHYTGDNRVRNLARTAVPTRRDDEVNLFLNNNYAPQAMNQRDYQPGNRTPWEHVQLDGN